LDLKTKEALTWRESETLYPGECVYIPKPGSIDEDDGVVVSIVLESDESKPHFLLILDAKSFKEIARAEIYRNDGQVPATIHGVFTPNT
jgi:carotenoid cleavage dioxygenase-like enzyme